MFFRASFLIRCDFFYSCTCVSSSIVKNLDHELIKLVEGGIGVYGISVSIALSFKRHFSNLNFKKRYYCTMITIALRYTVFHPFGCAYSVKEDPPRFCGTIHLRSPV